MPTDVPARRAVSAGSPNDTIGGRPAGGRPWPAPPLLLVAALCLLLGVLGGLLRLGWVLPVQPAAAAWHGSLVVGGFLGTLISLERALALGRWWPFVAPVMAALGAVALLVGWPPASGALAMTVASAVLVVVNVAIMRRQLANYTVTMALGAGGWLVANLLWLAGWPAYRLVPWWAAFLVLTIVGERLDLSRLRRPSPVAHWAFGGGVAILLAGAVAALVDPNTGTRLFGVGLVALAAWLARYDIAGRTVRQRGLPRYIAVCLLTGYGWLATCGVLMLAHGAPPAGPTYDAIVHSLFLGFVVAMIFGHMPIIAPLILGRGIAYRPILYLPLALLHLSLALRILGDLAGWLPGRQWGGLVNALALATFAIAVAVGLSQADRRPT